MTTEEQREHEAGRREADNYARSFADAQNPALAMTRRESLAALVLGAARRLPEPLASRAVDAILAAQRPYQRYVEQKYPAAVRAPRDPDELFLALEALARDGTASALFAAVEAACDQVAAMARDAGTVRTGDEARACGFFERLGELGQEE